MAERKLQMPPTGYGKMLIEIVVRARLEGRITPKDHEELVESWFGEYGKESQ